MLALMATRKQRIVILGGGMASLTTAYSLTSRSDWQERYDITLYQMGFRLGGKGASGRNRKVANRIEEHGIHVFFGFYDNAFRILKDCYEELDRPQDAPLARVTDAFKPAPKIAFTEKHRGSWSVWSWDFPFNDHKLGEGGPIPTPWGHVKLLLQHMEDWYQQVVDESPPEVKAILGAPTPQLAQTRGWIKEHLIPKLVERLWKGASPSAFAAVRKVIDSLQDAADEVLGDPDRGRRADRAALVRLVRRARVVRKAGRWIGEWLQEVPRLRRALTLLDFATTTIIGLVEDEIVFLPEDWRKIDDVDLKKWLEGHGADPDTSNCALIEGMYAGIFSVGPQVGAGTMLQYTLRMLFTYRGAVMHKMQAGMGDVIFAPLYQVLARRGVKFEFFHRVDRLELDSTRKRIARLVIGRQVAVKNGAYEPLYDVGGLPCWPSEPLYEQIAQGEQLRASGESLEDAWTAWPDALPPLVLEEGKDFDRVVLGISLGGLPAICSELIEDPSNPRFHRMLEALATTQTQAMQLWFRPDVEAMGWRHGRTIAIPYEEPFDTWTDMAHLVPRESWPEETVGSIAYLCSPMPDEEPVPPPGVSDYARRQHARVKKNARGWLESYAGWLWPKATEPSGSNTLAWQLLVDLEERQGVARLEGQHFSAPLNPSDRYNLSLPGTSRFRLRNDGSGYANLVLAGDWTFNPINAGCVEAATMSGLLAARAISGEPRQIPGDWISSLPDIESAAVEKTAPVARRAVVTPEPTLPLYVVRDANETPAPPFIARGTRMFVLPVEARLASLQALCNRQLHLGGPARYEPIVPLVLFYCQDNAEIESAAPRAGIRELDFGFLIPLLAKEPGRSARIVSFVPYLWVDTELACRAGRELYGYPKAAGQLVMPAGQGGVFSVDGMIAQTPEEGGRWAMRRIVEAWPAAAGYKEIEDEETDPIKAFRALLRRVGGVGAAWKLACNAAGDLLEGVVPMVFLKQFRAIEDPERACYQAIVEAPVRRLGGLRGGGCLKKPYELAVLDTPALPLAAQLGLRGGRRSGEELIVPVCSGFWLEFDFVMDGGRVVWRARSQD